MKTIECEACGIPLVASDEDLVNAAVDGLVLVCTDCYESGA